MNDMDSNFSRNFAQPPTSSPKYHQEETAPGVELQNYTKRTPSEDGTYVMVVTHTEKIEKIRQPLTPEEIAARKEEEKLVAKIVGGVFLGVCALFGTLLYLDDRDRKRKQDQSVIYRSKRETSPVPRTEG